MKKLWLFFALVFSLLLCSELSAQNISPQFSELKGMEDNQGNTHLLYRINSYQHGTDYESGSNDIYNLVPGTSIDTIYFYDHYSCGPNIGWGVMIFDYDYWENDLTKFIVSGNYVTCLEPSPFISRFNYENVYTDWLNYTNDIYISKQNDSLVFGLPNIISYDGGFIWDTLNLDYNAISVSSINDSIMFAVNFSYPPNSNLYKTIDRGNIYNVVDTGGFNWQSKFYYDTDGSYIYRTNRLDYPNCSLKGSADQGNAFTWQTVYETSNEFFVCLDESQSGAIYLADGKKIFFSSDYGTTFNLYKELGNRIIGIYK
ncbi:MAG: hypothetical protein ABI638_12130, partial [Ignavibacteriota bacterium]